MSLNKDLQNRLEKEFKPLGIAAFTNCCRTGCTHNYADDDFKWRKDGGITFIRLHLNGMNYQEEVTEAFAQYNDYKYLMDHWDEECKLIKKWTDVVGVMLTHIEKPKQKEKIGIYFTPLKLDPFPDESESELELKKLYVAGKWYDKEKIQIKIRELEQLGHEITHNWTICETEYHSTDDRLRANAIDDINGVKNADIVVVVMDDVKYTYRGTSHEVGAALALNKPVYLYCPDPDNTEWYQGCFSRHPCITLFRDWEDLKANLSDVA